MLIPQKFLTNEYDKGKTYRGKVVEEYIYIQPMYEMAKYLLKKILNSIKKTFFEDYKSDITFFLWQMPQILKIFIKRLAGHPEKWQFCEPLMKVVMEQCWN